MNESNTGIMETDSRKEAVCGFGIYARGKCGIGHSVIIPWQGRYLCVNVGAQEDMEVQI